MPRGRNPSRPTTSFLVEAYCPSSGPGDFAAVVERARAISSTSHDGPAGSPVRYVRSYLVPEDEMCMHIFEAASPEAVRRAAGLAGIEIDRIVETVREPSRAKGRQP